ncbi:DUF2249 domain-containing protein [Sulfitobacter sp. JB4-11]|uniref:DUF2249 domain-containing protein n=1 Tax=Sulfitobacter rhodophyticola TaxID=3238304 RepID=UPI0035148EB5
MSGGIPGKHWQAADGLHIDTRGLPPPDPLIAVLWHITQPGQTDPIIAHFDRDPIHLFPELAGRGWLHEYGPSDKDEVQLILRRSQ